MGFRDSTTFSIQLRNGIRFFFPAERAVVASLMGCGRGLYFIYRWFVEHLLIGPFFPAEGWGTYRQTAAGVRV